MGLNHVTILGNLTRDPELKEFDGGGCVCNFSVASNYSYKNKQTNERVDKVTFVEVKVNGPRAKVIKQYFAKGKPILIEGRLETQSWTQQDGQKRSKLVVVLENFHFLPKNDGGSQRSNSGAPNQANPPRHETPAMGEQSQPHDEVPF